MIDLTALKFAISLTPRTALCSPRSSAITSLFEQISRDDHENGDGSEEHKQIFGDPDDCRAISGLVGPVHILVVWHGCFYLSRSFRIGPSKRKASCKVERDARPQRQTRISIFRLWFDDQLCNRNPTASNR
jgi:hypothetical protein